MMFLGSVQMPLKNDAQSEHCLLIGMYRHGAKKKKPQKTKQNLLFLTVG